MSPIATLERGYAIVSSGESGAIVTDARNAPPGTVVDVRLARGGLAATVDTSRPQNGERGAEETDPQAR